MHELRLMVAQLQFSRTEFQKAFLACLPLRYSAEINEYEKGFEFDFNFNMISQQ